MLLELLFLVFYEPDPADSISSMSPWCPSKNCVWQVGGRDCCWINYDHISFYCLQSRTMLNMEIDPGSGFQKTDFQGNMKKSGIDSLTYIR